MAFAYTNSVGKVHMAHRPAVFIYEDLANRTEPKFRYINRLIHSSGSPTLVQWKQFQNANGYDVFDVRDMVLGNMRFDSRDGDRSIHELENILGIGTNSARVFYCQSTQEWAATADDPAVEQGTDPAKPILYLYGSYSYEQGREFDYDPFIINNTNVGRFLTNAPKVLDIEDGQYHTLAVINNSNVVLSINSAPTKVQYRYYDSSDTLLNTEEVENIVANGGALSSAALDGDSILFIGAGLGNLEEYMTAGNKPSDFPTLSYYTIVCEDLTQDPSPLSEVIRFNKVEADCVYPTVRVAWTNALGAWDYLNFTKYTKESVNIQRDTYKKLDTVFQNNNFNFRPFEDGTKVYKQDASKMYTLNSNWLDESQAQWLEELLLAPAVNMYVDGIWLACIVKNASFDRYKNTDEDLFKMTLELEASNEIQGTIL